MNRRFEPPFETLDIKSSFMTFVLKIFISGFMSDGTDATCVGFITGGGTFVAAVKMFPSIIAGSFGSMDEDLEVLLGVFGYKCSREVNVFDN